MGIVYSAKLEGIDEAQLYTRENYYTGRFVKWHTLHAPHPSLLTRFCALLGWSDCWCMQPTLWCFCRRHRLDRSTCGRSRPEPLREDSHRGGVRKYHGPVRVNWFVFCLNICARTCVYEYLTLLRYSWLTHCWTSERILCDGRGYVAVCSLIVVATNEDVVIHS